MLYLNFINFPVNEINLNSRKINPNRLHHFIKIHFTETTLNTSREFLNGFGEHQTKGAG